MPRFSAGDQRLLVGLDQAIHSRTLIGGKGASLSQLAALGAPVPMAFALTTSAYTTFAASLGLPTHVSEAIPDDLPLIRNEILTARLPRTIADAIAEAYGAIRAATGPDLSLAVRSSATAEDSADFSFAGLHDSVLDVRSLPALEAAVRACWASLWSERAVTYRRASGLATETADIAVVIQQLVRSDVSFVVFTADPISGNDQNVVISASWGLGEAIVSGIVTPDHIVVGPHGDVIEQTVGHKQVMVIPGGAPDEGVRQVNVPRMLQAVPVMTANQATEIAAMARSLSNRLGYRADLEGGIAGGSISLFQARPITTLELHSKLAEPTTGAPTSLAPTWDPTSVLSTP